MDILPPEKTGRYFACSQSYDVDVLFRLTNRAANCDSQHCTVFIILGHGLNTSERNISFVCSVSKF